MNDKELLRKLQFTAGMNPNDQDFGKIVRALLNLTENNPERMCELNDDDCTSCGA